MQLSATCRASCRSTRTATGSGRRPTLRRRAAGETAVRELDAAMVDVIYEGPERWDGVIQQDGNLGRTELLLGVSMTQTFGATSVSLTARFPIWRHIVTGDEPQGDAVVARDAQPGRQPQRLRRRI